MGNFTIFRCSEILGEAGKQEILLQMFRKFYILTRLPKRSFSENCRWVPLYMVSKYSMALVWLYDLVSLISPVSVSELQGIPEETGSVVFLT